MSWHRRPKIVYRKNKKLRPARQLTWLRASRASPSRPHQSWLPGVALGLAVTMLGIWWIVS